MDDVEKMFEENNIDEKKVQKALEERKNEAEEIISDEKKTKELLNKALRLCDKLSRLPVIGTVFSDVPVACMMVRDYVNGVYKEVPLVSIISLTAALVYFISPVDIILDGVPVLGMIDDAAVLLFVLKSIHNDIEDYGIWKEKNPNQIA